MKQEEIKKEANRLIELFQFAIDLYGEGAKERAVRCAKLFCNESILNLQRQPESLYIFDEIKCFKDIIKELDSFIDDTPKESGRIIFLDMSNIKSVFRERGLTADQIRMQSYAVDDTQGELKKFIIWVEGYAATGESGTAHVIGHGYGNNFDEAVEEFMSRTPNHGIKRNIYNSRRSNWNIWACDLFDNEKDARKSFG